LNRILLALAAALLALAPAGGALAQATAPDYPRGRISGYLFGDYYDNLAGDPRHAYNAAGADSGKANIDGVPNITRDLSGLQIRRMYFQLDNDLSARYSTRVRFEADGKSLTSDGKFGLAVKSLYVQARSVVPRTDVYAGIVNTPIIETVEDYWAYRSVEKVMADFRGISGSADLGVAVKGFVDANHVLGYSALVGDGTGQKPENNRQKRSSLALPIRWKDLHAEPYIDYENVLVRLSSGGLDTRDRLTWQGFLGYDLPRHAALGWQMTDQVVHSAVGAFTESRGHSFFGRIQPTDVLGAFARVDLWQPNRRSANRLDQQLWIGGIDWQPFKDVHVMPNVEAIRYRAKGTTLEPQHNDVQARITFYWRFSRPQS